MEKTIEQGNVVLSPAHLLEHWQGHRSLTRRIIEAFPEKELFEFSIGGMRPFAEMVKEMLAIAEPGLRELVTGEKQELDEHGDFGTTKAALLQRWDAATEGINDLWPQLTLEHYSQERILFGQYEFPVRWHLFYFIDNEIHHRGQAYVYLRALGIEPPFFWER